MEFDIFLSAEHCPCNAVLEKKHLQRSHICDILSQYFVLKISHLTAIQKGVIFSSGEKKASWQARFFLFVKQMLKASVKRKFDTCILLMF
ncbi:hypothetical protein M0O54_19670 [Acinetobacter lactucae]|uniref:Uncharacterized protein n=1 Tax=Acinetobacter lactucae TaxID=1785128 RepID=A0AB35K8K8_9GAMM|nr:hypothetical protein [Acinetobacter lactucae]EJB8578668.1 hypothetical protein [Acinetobacter baumannii]MDD9322291.1 hypothetical protein [Acinetobacter lactucae]